MSFTETCNRIFNQAIADYHVKDDIDAGLIPFSGILRISYVTHISTLLRLCS